jgi:hypothetical protein
MNAAECPLLALSGHFKIVDQCPLSGGKARQSIADLALRLTSVGAAPDQVLKVVIAIGS